ncbi:MAG: peptidase M61 [Ignavibacteria bacterium]|nr:peptidase M61 [Ignavibacteria bacterium]
MKLVISALTLILLSFNISSSQILQNDTYQYFVDLNKADNDQLEIELITPVISTATTEFKLPAMVPGTYKVYNFGRFISGLKAFDNSGNELKTEKKDVDTWEISNADKLYRLKYFVDDSFDDTSDNKVFEPAGTSIEKDTVFIFNNHGFFGYFKENLKNEYVLNFTKPEGFYGSSSLVNTLRSNNLEVFTAPDYQFVVDNPIMFCLPDTTTINFDETSVMISVYSPGKGISSADLSAKLKVLLTAIRNFLGGKLSADRYTFLFYFTNKEGSGSFGALEHNYSSLYFMPDVPKESAPYMINQLQSTSAHEFYHTVTPLNLHSEEIGNFDFNDPKMSKHLWLYEGVTEYFADYIQLREGLVDLKEYGKNIERKISGSMMFNDSLPFTEMSLGALGKYEEQYFNVYQKGALIGLSLDILIREESNGIMGLQDVINIMLQKYGKDKSFKDEDLFDEIVALTSPKIGEFFQKYVAGDQRIPYSEIFSKVGIKVKSIPYNKIDMGGIQMGFNQKTYRLVIRQIAEDNSFVKDLGVKSGDELVSINGKEINFMTMRDIFGSLKNKIKEGDNFEMVVARNDESGTEKMETLKAVVSKVKTAFDSEVIVEKELSEQQMKLKTAWLGK